MLKKLFCAALAVWMILSLAGCRGNAEPSSSTAEVSSAASEKPVSSQMVESEESTASVEETVYEIKNDVFFAPPVKGLEWGMPLEDVEMMLQNSGITDPERQENERSVVLELVSAQLQQLEWEMPEELKLGARSTLQFQMDKAGVLRLSAVTIDSYIPTQAPSLTIETAKEALRNTLCPLYGAAEETAGSLGMETMTWGMHGKTITEDEAAILPEATLKALQDNDYDAFDIYPRLTVSLMEPVQSRITLLYAGAPYVFLLYAYEF